MGKQFDYIAVDFDGTLCVHKFPEIGEPKETVISFIRRHAEAGSKIILHTCRGDEPGGRPHLTEAVEWCAAQGIPIDAVNENPFVSFGKAPSKLYADIYIDDRAVNPLEIELEDWKRDSMKISEELVQYAKEHPGLKPWDIPSSLADKAGEHTRKGAMIYKGSRHPFHHNGQKVPDPTSAINHYIRVEAPEIDWREEAALRRALEEAKLAEGGLQYGG